MGSEVRSKLTNNPEKTMSTRATIEIIERPNLHIHIYQEALDGTVWADIGTGSTFLQTKIAEDRDAYEALSAQLEKKLFEK